MILGLEIGLLVYGIIILSKGRMSATKLKSVYGGRARFLGVLCLLPLPLAVCIGLFIGASAAAAGRTPDSVTLMMVEAGMVVGMALVVAIVGQIWSEPNREAVSGPHGFPVQPLPPAQQWGTPPIPPPGAPTQRPPTGPTSGV